MAFLMRKHTLCFPYISRFVSLIIIQFPNSGCREYNKIKTIHVSNLVLIEKTNICLKENIGSLLISI